MSKAKDFKSKYEQKRFEDFVDEKGLNEKQQKILMEYDFPNYDYYKYPQFAETLVVDENGKKCDICGNITNVGFDYCGVYGPSEQEPFICPNCIKKGTFAKENEMEVAVCDEFYLEELGDKEVEDDVKLEILQTTTPPVPTANDMAWRTHCNDFAEYLGTVTYNSFKELDKECLKDIKLELKTNEDVFMIEDIDELYDSLQGEESSLTLHLFRCKHCGKYLIQIDLD